MKHWMIGVALATAWLGVVGDATAQRQRPNPMGGKDRVEGRTPEARVQMLDAKLALSPAQEKKALDLIKKRDAKLMAWAKDQKMSQESRTKRIREEDAKVNAGIRGMLSPSQKKTWDKMVKDAEARRKRLNSGPAKPRG